MEAILEKMQQYHIFTSLYPGVLFAVLADPIIHEWMMQLWEQSSIMAAFLFYFVGTLINRVGSLMIEPILKKTRIIELAPLANFIEAADRDAKIEVLSETNNMYRSLSALFLLLALVKFLPDRILYFLTEYFFVLGFFFMTLAYRKQTKYVVQRIRSRIR